VLRTKERAPIPYPFIIFTLGLVVETIQKFGGASFCNTILATSFATQLQHHFYSTVFYNIASTSPLQHRLLQHRFCTLILQHHLIML
jgi:hypothetical protein